MSCSGEKLALKMFATRKFFANSFFPFKGSLGTSVFDRDVYLVGASGGVYALLAAHVANVLLVTSKKLKSPFLHQQCQNFVFRIILRSNVVFFAFLQLFLSVNLSETDIKCEINFFLGLQQAPTLVSRFGTVIRRR